MMGMIREIEETPEHDAIVSAAEYIGIEPQAFAAALVIYKETLAYAVAVKQGLR